MQQYHITIIDKKDEEIDEIERIRREAFHLKRSGCNYYKKFIKDGKILSFALVSDDNQMIGGCYLGSYHNSIYIYYLFMKPEYQKTGLQLGRNLLLSILKHKKRIEELLHQSFEYSSLHPTCKKVHEIYESIGYQEVKNGYFEKRI